MGLIQSIKRAIPEQHRRWTRRAFVRARYAALSPLYAGNVYECPFCGGHFRRLFPKGSKEPVLRELRVVGAGYRAHSKCPKCDSYDRERHLYLYLRDRTRVFVEPTTLLHVAPEDALGHALRSASSIRYSACDLNPALADRSIDITAMPFADDSVDVIICGHVLQDVPHDRWAMAEMYRVLRPGGWAIVQVPLSPLLAHTLEDVTITSHRDRARVYGGADFVRLYGRDFERRLSGPGFVVRRESHAKELGAAGARRFGLLPDEDLFVATKPVPY